MGHNKEIGFVETCYFGGPALLRVDQPSMPAREYELTRPQWIGDRMAGAGSKIQREELPGKTVYVGPSSIFRMTPCSEEVARKAIEAMIQPPIKILHLVEQRTLASVTAASDDDDDVY
jgi:hypothetical protein